MDKQKVLSDVKQFITINLNEEYYGIDISYINSIERMQKITRVPKHNLFCGNYQSSW